MFAVITISFILLRLAPGDPVSIMLLAAQDDLGGVGSVQEFDALREELGFDLPIYQQYFAYLLNVIQGDLGYSFHSGRPVAELILRNLPATLILALAGMSVAIVIGVLAGTVAALHRNTAYDYVITTFTLFALSAPNFWLGILLLYAASFQLGWFPVVDRSTDDIGRQLHQLVLPALVVGTNASALIARVARSSMLDVLSLDYVRTARAKGLLERVINFRHALPNAAIPVVTIGGLTFANLLGGAVVIEVVFARQGLGRLVVEAVYNRDYSVVQGAIVVMVFFVILTNIAVDVLYTFLDPRIRYD